MAFPEKVERNRRVFFLHLNGKSYREIQHAEGMKSTKTVFVIVQRMRTKHANIKAFLDSYPQELQETR